MSYIRNEGAKPSLSLNGSWHRACCLISVFALDETRTYDPLLLLTAIQV